jgi:hypothetical protein
MGYYSPKFRNRVEFWEPWPHYGARFNRILFYFDSTVGIILHRNGGIKFSGTDQLERNLWVARRERNTGCQRHGRCLEEEFGTIIGTG